MSATEKFPIPKTNKAIFLIVLLVLVVVVAELMTPLYLQNRVNRLYKQSRELEKQIVSLESESLVLELEMNRLSSLERLSAFADSAELGLNVVPVKVMSRGGSDGR